MSGFENDVLVAENVNFENEGRPPHYGVITANGQLLIGNAAYPYIRAGRVVSPNGTLSIGYSAPNITMDLAVGADLHAARYIVSSGGGANGANYTTINDAYAAAVAAGGKQTVFIQPGTYTENLTLVSGVNLTAFGSDASFNGTGAVIINGTLTMTTAGSVTISGIQLQTNAAALLAVTGSAASIVNLNNCYLNCSNNTGITFSSSDAGARININNCSGNLGTTGIGLWTHTSAGVLSSSYSKFTNSGASTTATTNSAGDVQIFWSFFFSPLSTTSTGGMSFFRESSISSAAQNVTSLTIDGTGATNSTFSTFSSGTASAITVGTGATLALFKGIVLSSNTNAITGLGTLQYWDLAFNSSNKINTTTQVGGTVQGGQTQAPSAGFLGESISSANTAGTALTTATPANITTIALTAGVWDVSGMIQFDPGAATTNTYTRCSISLVSATNGTSGNNMLQGSKAVGGSSSGVAAVLQYRILASGATTVYLVADAAFSGGTLTGLGRISATRVG